MQRRGRVFLTSLLVAALVAPVVLDRDGLPLSTYPMYSRARGESVSLVTANGLTAETDRIRLGLSVIGASDDPLVVAGELRAAVRAGRADARCAEIAERVDADREIVSVEVVTERHDVVERTLGGESLIERTVHATCGVGSR
ncbi:MAG: hypothetical protein ACE37B_08895 [Ilumatobacter sp.]|jgi:hypothetical protein|uniref:hypothetical protein n=1 Tax=Ilumatobacter sp. TaxID=1967498 RepID=UPI00391DFCB0